MAPPKGNRYWEFRNKHGKDHSYTPEALWEEAKKYFKWTEENPLWEEKLFNYQGVITRDRVYKMRAMTETAFCLFADIDYKTWYNYKHDDDYFQVATRIEKTIYSQKFEGASADLLNPNIIARDLGLKDKSDVTSGDKPIEGPQIYLPDNGRNKTD